MDEDTITDLKQFITVTVRQEHAGLEERLTQKIESAKEEILAAVADTMQNHYGCNRRALR